VLPVDVVVLELVDVAVLELVDVVVEVAVVLVVVVVVKDVVVVVVLVVTISVATRNITLYLTNSSTATPTSSSTTTSTGSTSTTTSTTTTTTSVSTTTVTTTSFISSSTTSSTTTGNCNNLHWNQTGVIVANQFNNPSSLYFDGNDNLYVSDKLKDHVEQWSPNASAGVTVAGSTSGAAGSSSTLLNNPEDLTFDKNGFMYVADNNNNRVQRFLPNSTIGTTVAGTTSQSSSALTDLNDAVAIDVDENSNVYVLDRGNKRIVKWGSNATTGISVISNSLLSSAYDFLLSPTSSNQTYISNESSGVIYLWTFGVNTPTLTLDKVNDSISTLSRPRGMAFDSYGNLYVADRSDNRVVMYCVNSTDGIVIADSSSTTSLIGSPIAVAFDSNLNLYVLDSNNKRVVKFARL
ncbi:unnamed protein product, partial [Rotaria sp. Silwood1]